MGVLFEQYSFQKVIWEAFLWSIPLWKSFIDDIFLIFLGTTKQVQSMEDFINNIHPKMKFIFDYSSQEISFLDIKIHIWSQSLHSPVHKTCLYRKPVDFTAILHFHSNHSLKSKESFVFSKSLRCNLLITDSTLLQNELNSLTAFFLARQNSSENSSLAISSKPSSSPVTPFFTDPQGIKFQDSSPNCDTIRTGRKTPLPFSTRQSKYYWKWPTTA